MNLILALAILMIPAGVRAAQEPLAPPKEQKTAPLPFPDPSGWSPEERHFYHVQARVLKAKMCAATKDILGWGRALFPDTFDKPFCRELHEYLIQIRHEPFASTEAPRNHAKTTIKCFLVPLFQALEEPETFAHYLNVQATDEKALAINDSIKSEIEENEVIHALYGSVMTAHWTKSQFAIRIRKGPRTHEVVFTAKSAGQSIRGINYHRKRPDYILVDDLYNEEDINNPESTEKKNAWFKGTLMNCRAKTRRNCVHFQGTAINLQDLLEQHKKNARQSPLCDVADTKPTGRWVCRTFKGIKNWETHDVLWPDLNTYDELISDMEDMGSIIFMREIQNERWDEVSAIIKRSWLYPTDGRASWEIDPDDIPFTPSGAKMVAVRLGNDPSIGEKVQNDFNGVILVWVIRYPEERTNRFVIIDLWNEHHSLEGRLGLLDQIADAQPKERRITEGAFEAIAGFKDYVSAVRGRAKFGVKEIDHVKDKITKRQNMSRFFENRRVFLSKRIAPKLKDELVYQLTQNYPKHDDLADALFLTLDDQANWQDYL